MKHKLILASLIASLISASARADGLFDATFGNAARAADNIVEDTTGIGRGDYYYDADGREYWIDADGRRVYTGRYRDRGVFRRRHRGRYYDDDRYYRD